MRNSHKIPAPVNHVMAQFGASTLWFSLSADATLADLADRLDHLSEPRAGKPAAIYVRVGPGPRSTHGYQLAH
jgi:hypothetical protein